MSCHSKQIPLGIGVEAFVKGYYFCVIYPLDESSSDSEYDSGDEGHSESESPSIPDDCPSAPVYETPSAVYSAETIMSILLNPKKTRVCQVCPHHINRSATYVIDVTALAHPEDVKKDDFGRWEHKGSHPVPFCVRFRDDGSIGVQRSFDGDDDGQGDIYYLRRLYCTHPSNPDVKRMLAFITGMFK